MMLSEPRTFKAKVFGASALVALHRFTGGLVDGVSAAFAFSFSFEEGRTVARKILETGTLVRVPRVVDSIRSFSFSEASFSK